jgi:membrane-associated HD superfamily phosphohydrolase
MVVLLAQEYNMIRSKECFKCKTIMPLSEFYKHSAMGDGHLNKCKECAKTDVKKHREDNIEKVRAYDRERGKRPERMAAQVSITRLWRAEDKRRAKAHNAVSQAIKKGKLVRQSCERCEAKKTEAHHEDYDKPLEVMWLCTPCHKQRHKELKIEF